MKNSNFRSIAITIAIGVSIPSFAHAATTNYLQPTKFYFKNINQYEIAIEPVNPPKHWFEQIKYYTPRGVTATLRVKGGVFSGGKTKIEALPYPQETKTKIYSSQKVVYFSETPTVPVALAVSIIQPQMMEGKMNIIYPYKTVQIAENKPFANKLLHALMNDLPEKLYVLSGKVNTLNQAKETELQFTYRETPAQFQFVRTDVKKILRSIIKPNMNVYAKELTIHNWIASHVAYDYSKGGGNDTDFIALTKHKAECVGVTMLTYRMLTAAGIKNQMVLGNLHGATYEFNGKKIVIKLVGTVTSHIWNEVDLNGKWYHIDVTNDLATQNNGLIGYDFFNLTSAQLGHTHTWNHAAYPTANTDFVSVLQHSKNPQDKQILRAIEG